MPYYKIDPETAEEYGIELPPGENGFYEPAEATFDFEGGATSADGFMRHLRDMLLGRQFTGVRCSYDGGYDEGFAHFDHATVNGVRFDQDEMVALLKDSDLRNCPTTYDDMPEAARKHWEEHRKKLTPEKLVIETLEEFAYGFASTLLGQGFGTGECEIKGCFDVDLTTGKMLDVQEVD